MSYEIYHSSVSSVVESIEKLVESKELEISHNDFEREITFGGAEGRLRPSVGETKRISLELLKADGAYTGKYLHAQLYGRDSVSKPYELNMYIS